MVEKKGQKDSISGQANAPGHITARRERGKLAQRAFRQRQIDTIRSLEDENQKLRDAITAICDVAAQDNAALSLAISNARKIAGLPIAEVERQPSAPAMSSDDSGWSSSDSSDGIANVTPPISLEDDNLDFALSSYDGNESNEVWSQLLPADNSAMYGPSTDSKMLDTGVDISMLSSMYTGEQISSTGAFASWPDPNADRPLQFVNPPPDIVPYLGAGTYTLAGQLYWTAVAFGFQAIRAISESPSPPPAAVNIVTKLFTYTLRQVALPQIMYVMHARLLFRRYGYFQPPANGSIDDRQYWSWALDPAVTAEICAELGRRFQKAGIRKDDFLTPLDVERRLRDRFRDGYVVFEAALKGQALAEEHVACMRRLMQIMSRQSICFGDGPRWRPESVETLINGWEMNTSPVAVSC